MFGPHNGWNFHESNDGYGQTKFLEETVKNMKREHVACSAWVTDVAATMILANA
jgi:hypothetical protein